MEPIASSGTRAGTRSSRRGKQKADADDEAIPTAVASLSSAQPDTALSSTSNVVDTPKLFEFKFTSMESSTFQNYELNGYFHIPLMIDNGVLSIPTTNAGVLDVTGRFTWKLKRAVGNFYYDSGVLMDLPIHGKVIPKEEGSTDHVLRLGYECKAAGPSGIEFKAIDWGEVQDLNDFGNDELVSTVTIEEFAAKIGGDLKFKNGNGKDLSLYTVISELRPGQSTEGLKSLTKKPE